MPFDPSTATPVASPSGGKFDPSTAVPVGGASTSVDTNKPSTASYLAEKTKEVPFQLLDMPASIGATIYNAIGQAINVPLDAIGSKYSIPEMPQPDGWQQMAKAAGITDPAMQAPSGKVGEGGRLLQGAESGAVVGATGGIPGAVAGAAVGAGTVGVQDLVSMWAGEGAGQIAGLATSLAIPTNLPLTRSGFRGRIDEHAQALAGKKLEQGASDPASLAKVGEGRHGMTPGEITKDPGLIKLEEGLSRESPQALKAEIEHRRAGERSHRAQVDALVPPGATPEAIEKTVQRRAAETTGVLKKVESKAIREAQATSDLSRLDLGAPLTAEQAGESLRTVLGNVEDRLEGRVLSETKKDLDAAMAGAAVMDAKPLMTQFKALSQDAAFQSTPKAAIGSAASFFTKELKQARGVKDETSPLILPPTLQAAITKANTGESLTITADELYAFRKDLDKRISGQGEDPQQRFAKKELIALKGTVDQMLNEATGGKFGTYLQNTVRRYTTLDPFRQSRSSVAKAIETGDFPRMSTQTPESVIGSFIGPGKAANAREIKKAINALPVSERAAAMRQVNDAISGSLSETMRRLEEQGKMNTQQLSRFISNNQDTLKEYGLYKQMRQAADRRLDAETKSAKITAEVADRVKKLRSTYTVDNALKDPAVMKDIVKTVGEDRAALQGLRRQVIDHIFEQHQVRNENAPYDLKQQIKAWRQSRDSLVESGLFSGHHANRINDVYNQIDAYYYRQSGVGAMKEQGDLDRLMHSGSGKGIVNIYRFAQRHMVSAAMGAAGIGAGFYGGGPLGGMIALGGVTGLVKYENWVDAQVTNHLMKAVYEDPTYARQLVDAYRKNDTRYMDAVAKELVSSIAAEQVTRGQDKNKSQTGH